MKPFRGRKVEGPQGMIDVAWIKIGVPSGDRVRFSPQGFAPEEPLGLILLAVRHILDSWPVRPHHKS